MYSVAVSPDGTRIISGGDDGTVRVWDLATGDPVGDPITGHTGDVSVAVSPDGARVISGGLDGTVRMWDLATGDPIGNPLTAHTGDVSSVAVSPDGTRIISGGGHDGTVRMWDLATGDPIGDPITAHTGDVSVAVSPDGTRIISGGLDGTLRMWDLATGDPIGDPITGHAISVSSVAVSPDGTRIISGGHDGTVRMWDLATGDPVGDPITAHTGDVSSVAVSPDGTRILSGGGLDSTVRVWDLATGNPIGDPLTGHPEGVHSVAVSPDGTRIIGGGGGNTFVGYGGAVRVWDLATGDPVGMTLRGHTGGVSSVAVSPDGTRIISGGVDGTVRMWDLATGDPVGDAITAHIGGVWSVAVSPDGTRIIAGGGTVRVWNLATGELVGDAITARTVAVLSVAVSPDGTRIIGGGVDGTVRMWDLATGEHVGDALTGHAIGVRSVAVSPDGTRIISGGGGGTVRMSDLATGHPVGNPLTGHTGPVRSVAVSPDGTRIISAGDDDTVRIWTPFGPPRVVLGAGVVTDTATGADRLDLSVDVQILSALLAAVSTAPPLSIALMGRWGSGKSSLMEQLIAAVERLTSLGEPRGAYVRQVRQVRFNAWHYSDDHLWVGLIEQLFRELRGKPALAAASAESMPALQAKLGRVKTRQARLDRELAALDDLDPSRGWFGQLGVIRRAVVALRAAGQDAGEELRRRRFWFSLLFAVPAVLGVVAAVLFGHQLREWALTLPGIRDVPTALPWLVAAAGVAPALVGAVRTVWSTARTSGDELHTRLQQSRAANAKELQQLEGALTRLDPARQLDSLLAEISSEDRYATHRGLLGRVSADLHRLNDQLATQNDPAQRWRVILYIDDLDRCAADRVVEVLQAVNLLMSMELFFVVVAVDPRWLFAALDQHHHQLLTDATGRHDTGPAAQALSGRALDYLDKIFQVPFALRPVGARGPAFLRGLLPDPEPDPETAAEPHFEPSKAPAAAPQDAGEEPDISPASKRGRASTPPASASPNVARPGAAEPRPPATDSDPRPPDRAQAGPAGDTQAHRAPVSWIAQNLRLSGSETEFLPQLAGLLPTPRAMKKFTNLYRLLRLSIPPTRVLAFCGDRTTGEGPYQAAALLLAILISDPGQAGDLFNHFGGLGGDGDAAEDVVDALREAHPDSGPAQGRGITGGPAARRLASTITELRARGTFVHGRIATYQQWAQAVARFSFETYHLYIEPDTPPL